MEVPRRPDNRPFLLLGGVLALLALALLVPAARTWLIEQIGAPLHGQASPGISPRVGYTTASLVFWATLGGVFAWAAYELVFVRLRVQPHRRFFIALAPYLLFGPLLHALLVARAIPPGSALAYLAAEPPVYLTTGILAIAGFAIGAAFGHRYRIALAVGTLALLPLLIWSGRVIAPANASRVLILLAIAIGSALAVGYAYHRWRPREPLAAILAVVGAHALDGTTTWMVLRDPLGIGFERFAEKNPISLRLVELSNGWPYFAIKLALPILLLMVIKIEEGQERLHAFLLLAIFVLGYGPGMSNLLQVLFA